MGRPTKSRVVHANRGPNGEILCWQMGCGKLAAWWEDWERWAIKRWLSTAYCEDHRTGPDYPADPGHSERPVRQPVRAISHVEGKNVDHKVTRFEIPVEDAFSTENMTGAEANIRIRGAVVNSMADEVWIYEVPDREGVPLRIAVRTERPGAFSGPRMVREVFEQQVTGDPVRDLDWLERGEYLPPRPSRRPVKVGDEVSAMPDGYSLSTAEVISVEWKRRSMQAHYELPPLWTWEWRVEVKFPDGSTREDRWHSDWISKK